VGGRGSLALALVPAQAGRAALEALIGPLSVYEEITAEQAVQPPAAEPAAAVVDTPAPPLRPPSVAVLPRPVLAPAARLAALGQRLEAAQPQRSWGERLVDWQVHQVAARAAAVLPQAEWEMWRATARAAWDVEAPPATARMAAG
jgi:hypothetical protein